MVEQLIKITRIENTQVINKEIKNNDNNKKKNNKKQMITDDKQDVKKK